MTLFDQIAFGALMVCSLMCLYRIAKGPSAPDRAVAIDILGTLVVGFCGLMAFRSGLEYYVNIAIAWALISFIGSLSLAKYLEGRSYDA